MSVNGVYTIGNHTIVQVSQLISHSVSQCVEKPSIGLSINQFCKLLVIQRVR